MAVEGGLLQVVARAREDGDPRGVDVAFHHRGGRKKDWPVAEARGPVAGRAEAGTPRRVPDRVLSEKVETAAGAIGEAMPSRGIERHDRVEGAAHHEPVRDGLAADVAWIGVGPKVVQGKAL